MMEFSGMTKSNGNNLIDHLGVNILSISMPIILKLWVFQDLWPELTLSSLLWKTSKIKKIKSLLQSDK